MRWTRLIAIPAVAALLASPALSQSSGNEDITPATSPPKILAVDSIDPVTMVSVPAKQYQEVKELQLTVANAPELTTTVYTDKDRMYTVVEGEGMCFIVNQPLTAGMLVDAPAVTVGKNALDHTLLNVVLPGGLCGGYAMREEGRVNPETHQCDPAPAPNFCFLNYLYVCGTTPPEFTLYNMANPSSNDGSGQPPENPDGPDCLHDSSLPCFREPGGGGYHYCAPPMEPWECIGQY